MKTLSLRLLALLLGFGLIVAACGGGDDSGDDEGDSTTTTEEEEETTTTEEPEDTTTTTEAEEEDEGDDRDDAIGDFGDDVEDSLGDVPTDTTTYGEYVSVSDDSGFLTVDVPAAWSDVDGRAGTFGPDVTASTDVQAFFQTYDVSGLEFQATDIQTNQTPDEVLTAVSQGQASQCTSLGRQDYSDPLYTGRSEVFQDCAGTETDFVWLAFEPGDLSFHGVVGVQITNEADIEALERALDTFVVNV
jgi:serine protease Do